MSVIQASLREEECNLLYLLLFFTNVSLFITFHSSVPNYKILLKITKVTLYI